MVLRYLVAAGIAVCCARITDADIPARIDFSRDVQPILARHCIRCHGPEKQRSGLRLDHRGNLLRGGESGEPAVIPGKAGESHLIRLVSGKIADTVMPPTGKRLTAEQIAILSRWIDQGAKMPQAQDAPAVQVTSKHWSFQPLRAVTPPHLADRWIANEIDAFILARLQSAGLRPSAEADRRTLIRRLYLDMHGLPPTPEQVQQFVNDDRPDAWEQLVDRVLASPRYGERWAQHWLDVVRYADTHGYEVNTPRPNAWPYRDYVIESFNADKPYDRFIIEQIAGDAVGADRATGFLVAGPQDQVKSPDERLTKQQRQDELNEMITAIGGVFLGLTIGCARCHNHKFDPILQKDYYALQAIVAGVRYGDRQCRRAADPSRERQLASARRQLADARALLRQMGWGEPINSKRNIETFSPVIARRVRFTVLATNNGIEPCIDELEIWSGRRNVALASAGAKPRSSGDYRGNPRHKLEHINDGKYGNDRSWISNERGRGWVEIHLARPERIDTIVWGRDRLERYKDRTPVRYRIEAELPDGTIKLIASSDEHLPTGGLANIARSQRFARLAADQRKRVQQLLDTIAAAESRVKELSTPLVVFAGTFFQPGPTHRLYRGDPLAPREIVEPDIPTVFGSLRLPATSPEQTRRLALAKWIASADNPLTARVMVNRVWHYHFGRGIVATPSDFGGNGARPSHPQLLDWLARRFIEDGWSLKKLHRRILLSRTYRQSARSHPSGKKVDAGNRLLWRFPQRRLEAEAIRDSILFVAGTLNSKMGGPGFSVFKPNNNYVRVYIPKEKWGPPEWRRMIYVHKVRMEKDATFGAFDCPDAGQTAPRRSRSTTPIQALNLFNSDFVYEQARYFADRIEREAPANTDAQIDRAFRLALGRSPMADEMRLCRSVVQEHGLVAVCRALLNTNEFLFLP